MSFDRLRRRDFITLVGGAAAWPLVARAQPTDRVRRIGLLMILANDAPGQAQVKALQEGLEKLGWTNGRNLQIEVRWGAGGTEHLRAYAAELVALAPDLILAQGNLATTILSGLTHTIPIVFPSGTDPFENGLVTNMARPGGNVTGFAQLEVAIAGKYLELLKEAAPRLTRIAVLYNRDATSLPGYLRVINAAAPSLGMQTTFVQADDFPEAERAIDTFSREANGGLIVVSGPTMVNNREQIFALAARHSLPAIYPYRFFATDGGLMSYAPDVVEQYRRSASYVDRILKGENPGDLPVQLPTNFELVINLKAAKAIGLTIPESLLLRADELIE